MPNISCGYPTCTFTTGELPSAAAAAVLNSHTAYHAQQQSMPAPAKVEKVPRPTIDTICTTEDWSYFESRWNEYRSATQIQGRELKLQLLACCSEPLRKSLHKINPTISDESEQNIITAIRKLSVQEENKMIARVKLSNMRQDDAEKIPQFVARLKGQASTCKYTSISQCSNCHNQVTHDYTNDMVRDALIKGITDSDIRQDILGEIDQNMSLEQVMQYISAKAQAKQSASHLSGETTTGAIRSSHQRRKFPPTKNSNETYNRNPSTSYTSGECKYCGETGHGTNRLYRPSADRCPAIGKKCIKCNIFNHTIKVCRHNKPMQQNHSSAAINDSENESPNDEEEGGVFQLCTLSDNQ